MTEQHAITDRPLVDASSVTGEAHRPTRRELRAAQQAADLARQEPAADTQEVPAPIASSPGTSGAVSRRSLRRRDDVVDADPLDAPEQSDQAGTAGTAGTVDSAGPLPAPCRPPFVPLRASAADIFGVAPVDAFRAETQAAARQRAADGAAAAPGALPARRRDLRHPSQVPLTRATVTGPCEDVAPPAPRRTNVQRRAGKAVTALALTGALAVSGFALQQGTTASADPSATGRSAFDARIARSVAAQTARLTAQADGWARGEQTQALQAAQAALSQTDTVILTGAPILDAQTLTPLQDAAARLEALVEAGSGATVSTTGTRTTSAGVDGTAEAGATPSSAPDAARDAQPSRSDTRAPLAGTETEPAPTAGTEGDAALAPDIDAATVTAVTAQVTTLTAEVRASIEAKVAEGQAQALAAAAEAAAAAEMAAKVERAKRAPNGEIPADALCAPSFAPQALLRCDAAQALEHLEAAYRAQFGHDLEIVSSYRSYAAQVATRRARGWLAAVPGTSNHGLALAVDFGSFGGLGNFSTAGFRWMKAHADDYGWHHPSAMERGGGGPQEPWHWEFGTN